MCGGGGGGVEVLNGQESLSTALLVYESDICSDETARERRID